MPLAADRNTKRRDGSAMNLAVAASTIIYAGSLVCRNASGNAVPGSVATTLKALGVADQRVDNSAGSAGAKSVQIRKGVFCFANSSAGDLIAIADIGNDCYIVDDQTVAKTNGGSTRSIAGKVFDVDAGGVWVQFV